MNLADLNQYLVENKVRVCGLGANDEDMEKFFVEKLSIEKGSLLLRMPWDRADFSGCLHPDFPAGLYV